MILIQKKGPAGADGTPGIGSEIGGKEIDDTTLTGLENGDVVAFEWDAGGNVMVPVRLFNHSNHRLTFPNGDYIDCSVP